MSWWGRSLQCKSRAFDDVFHPSPKLLTSSYSCRRTSHSIKDVIETRKKPAKTGRRNRGRPHPDPNSRHLKPDQPEPDPNSRVLKPGRPEHGSDSGTGQHVSNLGHPPQTRRSFSARNPDSHLPVLAELSEGHPSRNVVEIIFHSSWNGGGSDNDGDKAFTGQVEMIFKVENGPRTVARFEEYREAVTLRALGLTDEEPEEGRAREENARCVADGNEMMRFYCLGAWAFPGGAWSFPGSKGMAIVTYSGSGEAHANAGGGGGGRRAMLVCRVIAGRISTKDGFGFDSVMGRNGELLVFDTRAVLPCFLIIYRL